MAIVLKSQADIEKIRVACRVTAQTLEHVGRLVKVGVTTRELDKAADDFIRSKGGVPNFLNYRGFPKSCCISINEEVIHGVPGNRRLKDGDLVSVDLGAMVNGYHGDAARSFLVGKASDAAKKLVQTTERCFFEAAERARHGGHLHEMCAAIQDCAERNGYSVVKDYCGHGVGKDLHEDPAIPCFKPPGRGCKLTKGMTLAIEPMVNLGKGDTFTLQDKWTVVTKDHKLSAHYENSLLITDGEADILTLY